LCRSNYNGSYRIIHVGTGEAVPSPTPDETDEPVTTTDPVSTTGPEVTATPSPLSPQKPESNTPSERPTENKPEETTGNPVDSDTLSDSGL